MNSKLRFKSHKDIIILGSKKSGPKNLGKGGYADVRLIHHVKDPSTLYAMKIISKKNQENLILVKREIKLH